MAVFRARVSSPDRHEAVFRYLADFRTVADWDPGVASSRRVDGGPVRVGSEFDVAVAVLGRELTLRYRVLEYDPPARVVLHAESSWLRSHDEIRVAAVGEGTRVDYCARLELRGALRVFDAGLQRVFSRIAREAAAGLARALDGHWEELRGRRARPCYTLALWPIEKG